MEIAKAWVFKGPGKDLDLQQVELPQLKEGEVMVKNNCCTICKSDLITFLGKRPGPVPSILGHEILGEIVDTGGEVKDYWGNVLKEGDLVTWSVMAFCGKCRNCKNGMPQKCNSLKKYGHERMEGHYKLTGGFSSNTHILPGTVIYKLPSQLPSHLLAGLNCSWATIAAAMRLAGDVKGKNVLITGAGMLGILTTMNCKHAGAANILVVEQSDVRLELAKHFGADYLIPVSSENKHAKQVINEILKNEGIDCVFEMTGANSAVQLGLDMAGLGATIVLGGSVFPTGDVRLNPERIVRNLLQIKGIHNYTPVDLANAIEFMQEAFGKYPLEKLFDEQFFSLETIDDAVKRSLVSSKHRVVIKI